jgi:hypothetical protein
MIGGVHIFRSQVSAIRSQVRASGCRFGVRDLNLHLYLKT